MACAVAAVLPLAARAEGAPGVLDVVYPRVEARGPEQYGFQLLRLALEKAGVAYRLSITEHAMNFERARAVIERGEASILDFGTSPEFEARFDAVYFPVDRGLSGYRLLVVRAERAGEFAGIRTLDALRRLTAGQGVGWADVAVLRSAGLPVETAAFDQLFRMVNAGRFDYFPLGVEEAYGFLDAHRAEAPDAVVEGTLALHYPFGRLFFVRKGDAALRDAVQRGLERAFADGSLQRTLHANAAFEGSLRRAQLRRRRVLELPNPALTERFRQIPAAYFLRP